MGLKLLGLCLNRGPGAPQLGDDRRCQTRAVAGGAQGGAVEAGGRPTVAEAAERVPLGDQRAQVAGVRGKCAVCRFDRGAVALFRIRHVPIGGGRTASVKMKASN